MWLYKKDYRYLHIHFSNDLERLQRKPADCHVLLKAVCHQKNLKREKSNVIKQIFWLWQCNIKTEYIGLSFVYWWKTITVSEFAVHRTSEKQTTTYLPPPVRGQIDRSNQFWHYNFYILFRRRNFLSCLHGLFSFYFEKHFLFYKSRQEHW